MLFLNILTNPIISKNQVFVTSHFRTLFTTTWKLMLPILVWTLHYQLQIYIYCLLGKVKALSFPPSTLLELNSFHKIIVQKFGVDLQKSYKSFPKRLHSLLSPLIINYILTPIPSPEKCFAVPVFTTNLRMAC